MTVKAPNIPIYPDDLPVPTRQSHGGEIDYGVYRSSQQGFPDQERLYSTNPTTMGLQFQIHRNDWDRWLSWVNTFGLIQFCKLPAVNQVPVGFAEKTIMRFLSVDWSSMGADWRLVQARVSLLPLDVGEGLTTVTPGPQPPVTPPSIGSWFVGGTPRSPSSLDWIIAGTPPAPNSSDNIIAQTPGDH